MQLTVKHLTLYSYEDAPHRSTQIIRLTPLVDKRQKIRHWQVDMPASAPAFVDAFGNSSHLLCLENPATTIEIFASGTVDVFESEEPIENARIAPLVFLRDTPLTKADSAILQFIEPLRHIIKSRPLLGLTDLMMAILEKMPYQHGSTTVAHTASESFAGGMGVCQDHAHVFISCCRAMGIPTRYVSGYIYSPDFAEVASHAWADAWIGNRWASFDISNQQGTATGTHIRLAIGLDYLDACPVRGIRIGGFNEELHTRAEVKISGQ